MRPKVGQVSLFDLSQQERLIQSGYVAARKAIPALRALLHKKGVIGYL